MNSPKLFVSTYGHDNLFDELEDALQVVEVDATIGLDPNDPDVAVISCPDAQKVLDDLIAYGTIDPSIVDYWI